MQSTFDTAYLPRRIATAAAVGLGLSIPVSVALDNLLLVLVALIGGYAYRQQLGAVLRTHPAARASLLLFAWLLLGCFWGSTPIAEAFTMLMKYVDLAFIPLLLVAFAGHETRRRTLSIFIGVMAVTAVLTWAVGLGWLERQSWMWEGTVVENPAILRSSITQNVLMVFAAYLCLLRARESAGALRVPYLLGGLFMLATVLFMVPGRTGYLAAVGLIGWLLWSAWQARLTSKGIRANWRHALSVAAVLAVIFSLLYGSVPRLQQRVDQTLAELHAWRPHSAESETTSIGQRLEFYYNSLTLFAGHPLAGVGTGGLAAAYQAEAARQGLIVATKNPHNEYLNLLVQAGLPGLLLFLYLIATLARCALRITGRGERDAAVGLVLTLFLSCLVNSSLMDHTEGLFFACMAALTLAPLTANSTKETT